MTSCTRQTGYAMKGAAEMPTGVNCPIGHGSRASRDRARMRRAGLLGLLAIWMLSAPAFAAATEQVYYFHNDHLGTPQAISDAAGRKVWEAEYEPFGKAVVNADPDGDGQVVVNNLRFPGQYYDAETGLHYNYHRDYDPQTGRYLTPDPIGLEGGLNPYIYVYDNPVVYFDPYGLEPNQVCVAAFTMGGSVVFGAAGYGGGLLVGGTGGTLVGGPGVGTLVGAVGGAEAAGAGMSLVGATVGNAAGQAFCPDESDCRTASPFQLAKAGISDPHAFKEDYVGRPVARYDICACKDGSIKIAGHGQCGTSGPKIDTWARWK